MHFHPVECSTSGLIGYLLCDPDQAVAVAVDPPRRQTELILALLREHRFTLNMLLRTHVHPADQDDCAELVRRCGAEALQAHPGAQVVFGSEVLRVLATPGHTPGCVSYLWRDRLFCGDVFELGRRSTADEAPDPALLYDSLTGQLFTLPNQTLVFPAHPMRGRRVSTLAELKTRLAPLLGGSRDAFINTMMAARQRMPRLAD